MEQTKLERDSHQRALITAVEEMRAETELKWRREMELAVRAESSRVKQWAEDRVAKKERVLLKRYQTFFHQFFIEYHKFYKIH